MLHGGPPTSILMVRGHRDAHFLTDERLRLGRLANDVVLVDGVEAGLAALMPFLDDAPMTLPGPGLVITDLDGDDTERFLDGVRRAEGTEELTVLTVVERGAGPDVRAEGLVQRVERPASLFDMTAAVNRFGRYRFEVELVDREGWYETRMWLCHAVEPVAEGVEPIDLAGATAADGIRSADLAGTTVDEGHRTGLG